MPFNPGAVPSVPTTPVVKELKMEEILLKVSEAREQASDLPGHCPDYMSALKHIKLGSTLDKKESWVLNPLKLLRAWPTLLGLTGFYDSQGETNSIVQVKPSGTFACKLMVSVRSLPGIIAGAPRELQFEVSPMGWTHCLRPFSNWDSGCC